jgi:hypothetical protein
MSARAKRRRGGNFNFLAKRRHEIVLHARHVGAAETDDLDRWLIAWVWHNPGAKDQIWSVMNCARNMGRKITEKEASAITEEASITRRCLTADDQAKFLGVIWEDRQALGLTTIGSIDVKRLARRALRKHRDLLNKERKRRARGVRPRAEYEANSLSSTKPWEELGMSRRTWYRQRTPHGTSPSAPIFLTTEEAPVPPEAQGLPRGSANPKEKKADLRLATATMMVADRYAALPLELRMAALCLPLVELRAAA